MSIANESHADATETADNETTGIMGFAGGVTGIRTELFANKHFDDGLMFATQY